MNKKQCVVTEKINKLKAENRMLKAIIAFAVNDWDLTYTKNESSILDEMEAWGISKQTQSFFKKRYMFNIGKLLEKGGKK
jgi:hypothetical protein